MALGRTLLAPATTSQASSSLHQSARWGCLTLTVSDVFVNHEVDFDNEKATHPASANFAFVMSVVVVFGVFLSHLG
jgi:hypothetical protein